MASELTGLRVVNEFNHEANNKVCTSSKYQRLRLTKRVYDIDVTDICVFSRDNRAKS